MCHTFFKLTITLINRSKFCYCSAEKEINTFTNPDILFKEEKRKNEKVKEERIRS